MDNPVEIGSLTLSHKYFRNCTSRPAPAYASPNSNKILGPGMRRGLLQWLVAKTPQYLNGAIFVLFSEGTLLNVVSPFVVILVLTPIVVTPVPPPHGNLFPYKTCWKLGGPCMPIWFLYGPILVTRVGEVKKWLPHFLEPRDLKKITTIFLYMFYRNAYFQTVLIRRRSHSHF